MSILAYTQTVMEHPDMGNFVSVMIAILIASSMWDELTKWLSSLVSCCGVKLFAWGSKHVRRDKIESLHTEFLYEEKTFERRTTWLFKPYHVLALLFAVAGLYILYAGKVQCVGKYSLWLALPIALYFAACVLFAIVAWGKQAVHLIFYIIHASIEGKKVNKDELAAKELDEIMEKRFVSQPRRKSHSSRK